MMNILKKQQFYYTVLMKIKDMFTIKVCLT